MEQTFGSYVREKRMKGIFLFGHKRKAGPGLATLPDPICRFLAPHIL